MQTKWYPLAELQRFLDRATSIAIDLAGGNVTPQQLRGGRKTASIVKTREILIHVLRRTLDIDRRNGINPVVLVCVEHLPPQGWTPISAPMLAFWLKKDHSSIVLALAKDRYADDVERACRVLGREYRGRLAMEIRRERRERVALAPMPHLQHVS